MAETNEIFLVRNEGKLQVAERTTFSYGCNNVADNARWYYFGSEIDEGEPDEIVIGPLDLDRVLETLELAAIDGMEDVISDKQKQKKWEADQQRASLNDLPNNTKGMQTMSQVTMTKREDVTCLLPGAVAVVTNTVEQVSCLVTYDMIRTMFGGQVEEGVRRLLPEERLAVCADIMYSDNQGRFIPADTPKPEQPRRRHYSWPKGSGYKPDPNLIGQEIEDIAKEIGTRVVTAEDIVRFAKRPETELHTCFECWEKDKAMQDIRLQQAQRILDYLCYNYISVTRRVV